MSYRDMRSFTEMMRALGYRRLISMENFQKPNFPLVAEVLVWLINRYDPNARISTDIDTREDRVIFIKSAAEFMATKAHIKLNTKKLYQADWHSVKELLKVTSVLYDAIKTNSSSNYDNADDDIAAVTFDVSAKMDDLKEGRRLVSEITKKGAILHDLLGKEVDLKEARSSALGRQLEINDLEKLIKQSMKSLEEEKKKMMSAIDNVASDEANLEMKIEKKQADLGRNQKRLETLQSVRPAYMDDYEVMETDLQSIYNDYMMKFRNMVFLEQALEEYQKNENERNEEMENHLHQMISQVNANNRTNTLQDESDDSFAGLLDGDDDSNESEDDLKRQERPLHARQRPGGASAKVRMGKGAVVKGSMGIDIEDDDDDDDEDDDDGSLDSKDLEDGDEDDSDLTEDDEGPVKPQFGRKPPRKLPEDEDDF